MTTNASQIKNNSSGSVLGGGGGRLPGYFEASAPNLENLKPAPACVYEPSSVLFMHSLSPIWLAKYVPVLSYLSAIGGNSDRLSPRSCTAHRTVSRLPIVPVSKISPPYSVQAIFREILVFPWF